MINEMLDEMWNILKENVFQIDVSIKSELLCISCKNITIKPFRVPCGCLYCYDCLISYLNEEDKFCLGDSESCNNELIKFDVNVFIDQPTIRRISKIVVKCPLGSCEWKLELGKIADHMRTCDRLESKQKNLETQQLDQSNQVEEMILAMQTKSKADIELVNQKYDLLKNNQKQMEIRMEKLFQESKSRRDELETITRNMIKQETILEIQTKIEENEQGIKANTEEIENWKQRLDCKCEDIRTNQVLLKDTFDKIAQENATIKTESKQIENGMMSLETKVTQIQANLKCDEFLWCIKNWDEKMKQAQNGTETEICSDPFYSHKNGYKICLKLYPNGDGDGEGTYLSLYVCIMQGEFDNILQWPFRREIKLDLINQETCLVHISRNLNSNNIPTSEIGFSRFMELSELCSNAVLFQSNEIWIRATL